MQQVPKWYKQKTQATSGPPGSKHRAPSRTPPTPFLSLRFSSFALGKWPGACQAAPGSGRGRRPRGTFLCRARDNAGRAPHPRGSGRQARRPGPSPGAGREAPPRQAPSPAPLRGPPLQSWRRRDPPAPTRRPRPAPQSLAARPAHAPAQGRRPPRGEGHPAARGAGSPPGAPSPYPSSREVLGRGRPRLWATPPGPTELVRAPRNSPGPGGPLGIIPSRARPGARGSRVGKRTATGKRRRGGRRGPGAAQRRVLARGGGQARRGAAAERGAGRGGRPCAEGEEAAATRAARTIPLGGGGRGFQEIQTLRQEIGILTKHSQPRAAPRRGLPPRLTLGPPAATRGARAGPQTSARVGRPSLSAPCPGRPASSLPEVEGVGFIHRKPWTRKVPF